jgi:DNA-binding transcriptional LysR family regulator
LGISRAAVSRAIAELEAFLGIVLFERKHRSVSLTQAGTLLAAAVRPAFQSIDDQIAEFQRSVGEAHMSITTTSAFATYWLLPRLQEFCVQHPEFEVNLQISNSYLDLKAERIDIAIRYGGPNVVSYDDVPILTERLFPVYSPKYQPRTSMACSADLLEEDLLQLVGTFRPDSLWPHWFRMNGVETEKPFYGPKLNNYTIMIQAALEGQGVALAGEPLINPFLKSGRLIRVPGAPYLKRDSFRLLTAQTGSPAISAFKTWIMKHADETATGSKNEVS